MHMHIYIYIIFILIYVYIYMYVYIMFITNWNLMVLSRWNPSCSMVDPSIITILYHLNVMIFIPSRVSSDFWFIDGYFPVHIPIIIPWIPYFDHHMSSVHQNPSIHWILVLNRIPRSRGWVSSPIDRQHMVCGQKRHPSFSSGIMIVG